MVAWWLLSLLPRVGVTSVRTISPHLSFLILTYSLAAALVSFIVTAAYKDVILSSPSVAQLQGVDTVWRLLIGLGCVPGVVALYFRLTIPETPRFTMDIERNVDQASTDIDNVLTGQEKRIDEDAYIQRIQVPKASWADFRAYFGQPKNFKLLFGCAYSWFALDVSLNCYCFPSVAHSPHRLLSTVSDLTLGSSYKLLVLVVPSPRIPLRPYTRTWGPLQSETWSYRLQV